MIPTGSFMRFERDIIERYHDYGQDEYVTFGILIADPRQSDAKQYIYNYLDVFNQESDNCFDFFIPGYVEHNWPDDAERINITVNNKEYYFSFELFKGFLTKIEECFKIECTFNPMLILMSMKPGCISTAKYFVIELDNVERHDIRRVGMVFRKIFKFAQSDPQLRDIHHRFITTYIKGNWLKHILTILEKDNLVELIHINENIAKYRIK